MRYLPPVLLLLFGGAGLWAGDVFLYRPPESEVLTLGGDVLRSIRGDERIQLDYGENRLLLEKGFLPSGRTLIQLYDDRNSSGPIPEESSLSRGSEFTRPYLGGSLVFSPLRPNRLTWIGERKEDLIPESLPEGGVLLFFVTGGDFFWLGNGTVFFCYDRQGAVTARYTLKEPALLSAADDGGRLYLSIGDGTFLSYPPREGSGSGSIIDRSFDETGLFLSGNGEALEIMEREREKDVRSFTSWLREWGEALYRKNPLNRELGEFLRTL